MKYDQPDFEIEKISQGGLQERRRLLELLDFPMLISWSSKEDRQHQLDVISEMTRVADKMQPGDRYLETFQFYLQMFREDFEKKEREWNEDNLFFVGETRVDSLARRNQFIKNMFGYDHPQLEQYQSIADKQFDFNLKLQDPYATQWTKALAQSPALCDFFQEKLKGQPLVDLGGGFEVLLDTAAFFESSAYVDVNAHLIGLGYLNKIKLTHWKQKHHIGPFEDLRFRLQELVVSGSSVRVNRRRMAVPEELRHTPPHFTPQTLSEWYDGRLRRKATDLYLVNEDMLLAVGKMSTNSTNFAINGIGNEVIFNNDYHKLLAKEIERVLPVNGIVFGAGSAVIDFFRESGVLEELDLETFGLGQLRSNERRGKSTGIFIKRQGRGAE